MARTHQEVVAGHPPEPTERAADRGRRQLQPPGRTPHAAFLEQSVEHSQQIQIHLHTSKQCQMSIVLM
ncbi:hypothetical protein GCM10009574_095580 [Streptomyces asiaticus]|uniref:Uncharacterized protein n=2 Tax=Streptomyces rhizosphaericus TaxID=114699 RepID=A0ABP4BY36_9ACTN